MTSRTPSTAGKYAAASVVAALVFLITIPAIHNGFVDYDDPLYLKDPVVSKGLTAEGVAFAAGAAARTAASQTLNEEACA
jgi:hypothetical protein